jgi:hypothetical protein
MIVQTNGTTEMNRPSSFFVVVSLPLHRPVLPEQVNLLPRKKRMCAKIRNNNPACDADFST